MEELILLNAIGEEDIFQRKEYNNRDNAFDVMTEREFIRSFRLSKIAAEEVINICAPHMVPPSRISALDIPTRVLCALRFFGRGSYQQEVADNLFLNVSQSSISRAITEVTTILNRPEIIERYIRFPENFEELDAVRRGFFSDFNFPGVVGCIDCTHVAIVAPPNNDPNRPEHTYVNRKGYHSLNVQLICDAKLKILSVNARFPGSTHDARIWSNSNINPIMENIYRNGRQGYYLLGDSGYPLRPWLLTPLPGIPNLPGELRYNNCHKHTRSIIERCNGVLKTRFRCLLKHRMLHYTPEMAGKIVNSCAILHNICINHNLPFEDENDDDDIDIDLGGVQIADYEVYNANRRVNPDLAEGRRVQQTLIRGHFAN